MDTEQFDAWVAEKEILVERLEAQATEPPDEVLEQAFRVLRDVRVIRRETQRRLSTVQRLQNRIERAFEEEPPPAAAPAKPPKPSPGDGPFLYDEEGGRYSLRIVGGNVVAEPVGS